MARTQYGPPCPLFWTGSMDHLYTVCSVQVVHGPGVYGPHPCTMWEFNQMPCLITQHPLHWLKSFSLHIPFNTLYFIHQRHFIYNAGSSCIQCYFFFMLLTALYKIPLLNDFRLFSLTPTIDDAQSPPAVKRVCAAKNTAMQLDEEEESKFKGGRLQVNYEFSNSPEESIASFLCISAMRHINRCKQ